MSLKFLSNQTTDNKIGIGTNVLNAKLSLYDATEDVSINVNTGTGGSYPKKTGISFGATSTSLGGDVEFTGGAGIQAINTAASNNITDLAFWTTTGGSPTEKMRILSDGNVIIGSSTLTGSRSLTLLSATNATDYDINFQQAGTTNHGRIRFTEGASDFQIFAQVGQSPNLTLQYGGNSFFSRGNVGIGEPGPAVKLQVSTNSPTNNVAAVIGDGWVGNSDYHKEGGLLLISGTSQDATQTGAGIAFQTRNTANTNYWKSSMIMDRDGAIRFTLGGAGTTAGSEDFTILSGGNVGIGTDSPTAKLQVAGTTTYNSDSAQALRVCDAADVSKGIHIGFDTTENAGIIQAGDFGVAYANLSLNPNAGNVGIGTTSPGSKLTVSGSFSADTGFFSSALTLASDLRLQSNITILNKAQTSYISFATRNTSGSEAVMDLTNVGSINGGAAGPYLPLSAGSGFPLTGTLYGTSTNFSGSGDYAGSMILGNGASTAEAHLTIGQGRTDSGFSYIDLVGGTTYPDYGLRIIRGNTGANAVAGIYHRGTGNLDIQATDSASILLKTNNTTALTLTNTQNAIFTGNVNVGTGLAGTVNVGLTDAYKGVIEYLAAADTNLNIKNTYDSAAAAINFQLRTSGTTVNALTLLGSGSATFAGSVIASNIIINQITSGTINGNINIRNNAGSNIVLFNNNLSTVFSGTVTAATYYKSSGTSAVLGTNAAGEVLLRPTSSISSTAQSSFTTTLATIGTNLTVSGSIDAGAISGSSFTDGIVTWTGAQFNRVGAAVEFQFAGTAGSRVKFGSNGSNPITINADTGIINATGATFTGSVTAADLLTVNGDGHLFLGADGETPKIDMMYDDHASGPGWDTRIFTGKTDDLPNGQSFPTSTSAGGYGTQYQANSDGAFFGIIPYPLSTSTHYRPIINWGDDATDTPFSLQHNGVDKFTVSYQGKIAGTGHSWDAFRPQGQTGSEAVGSAANTLLLSGASVNLLAGNGTGAANLQIGGTTIVSSTRNASFVTAASSTATSSGDADATLTTKGYVDGLITASTAYRGTWNPDKTQNSGYGNPNLSTVTQTSGYYYICSADGIAEPNGTGCEPNSWNTGDWVVWSDDVVDCAGTGTGGWQKIDNSSVLSGSGTANTIPLWTSTEALSDSIITQQSDDEVSILSTSATTGQNGKLTIYSYDDGDTDVKNLQLTVNNGGDANITNTGPYLNLTALNYIKSNNVHIFNQDTFMYNGKYIRFLDATAPQDSWNRTLGVSATDIVQVGGIAGYNTGKGQLELFSNNAQAMFIDENQYVGIGTGTPSTRLHVKGGADDNEALLYVENTHAAGGVFHPAALFTNVNGNHSYGTLAEFRIGNAAGTDRPQILFTNGVTSNNWSVGQGVYSANDNFAIGFRSAHPNTSSGWATSNFVIATSGEVGIGKVPDANNILDIQKDNTSGSFVTHRNNTGFALNRSYGDYGNDGNIVEYQERIGVDGNLSSIGNFSNHTLGIQTNNQNRITILAGGNVGINSTSPPSLLDVQPTTANRKVTRIANDVMSTYFYNTQADAVLAWTCGSYYQAEVVITANQTNGGTTANLYIRGIWSNNHTSHHWDELEHIGSLPGSTITMSVGQNGATTASGRLELDFNYISGSFAQLNVRVTDFYGSHAYTIT
jgi:hypothetical protein